MYFYTKRMKKFFHIFIRFVTHRIVVPIEKNCLCAGFANNFRPFFLQRPITEKKLAACLPDFSLERTESFEQ